MTPIIHSVTHRRYRRMRRKRKGLAGWIEKKMLHLVIICLLLLLASDTFLDNDTQPIVSLVILGLQWTVILITHGRHFPMVFGLRPRKRKTMRHPESTDLTGKTIKIKDDVLTVGGHYITIIDWVDRLAKKRSWMDIPLAENECVAHYAMRHEETEPNEPGADDVLYGVIGEQLPFLVHVNELDLNSVLQ